MPNSDLTAVVRALCGAGESYYVEYKSAFDFGPDQRAKRDLEAIAHDIGRTVVAFANADGGDLLVGVEDSGQVTGVPFEGDRLLYLASVHRALIREAERAPDIRVHDVDLDGYRVLLFRVASHPDEPLVTSDGRCLIRDGATSRPATPREIESRRRHREGDQRFEAAPVPDASLADIDVELMQRLADANLVQTFSDPLDLLSYWNLLERRNGTAVLRRAALLLFAREPLRWHANNRIRIRRVLADEEGFGHHMMTRERDFTSPVGEQLRRVVPFLTRELEREAYSEQFFVTTSALPAAAVTECVVNAVAHRNYAIEGQSVEILLYPDRAEFRSPGRLPASITVDDLRRLRGVHRSRNPIMMRVLRDLGWTRDQGEGMRRIFGSMRQVELHAPELEEHADTFVVRLSTRSRYDDATQAWLSAYGPFGLRPETRKYMVALRDEGGSLSVDKLARSLEESYDQTKEALVRLEALGLVWHKPRSRTYRLVEPLSVPHERALVRLKRLGVPLDPERLLDDADLTRLAGTYDQRTRDELARQWVGSGILTPAGQGRWRLGASLLAYADIRDP